MRRQYDIDIFKLADGEHQFELEVNDAFFALFNYGLIEKGKAEVALLLKKSSTMLTLHFAVKGTVELICDRSLEPFEQPIELEERLIVKYGEEEQDLDDDLLIITQNTQKINVAQFIYEIIGISLPMKKIHPDYLEEDDEDEFDDLNQAKLVYSSLGEEQDIEEETNSEEEEADPRWAILKKLKNN